MTVCYAKRSSAHCQLDVIIRYLVVLIFIAQTREFGSLKFGRMKLAKDSGGNDERGGESVTARHQRQDLRRQV